MAVDPNGIFTVGGSAKPTPKPSPVSSFEQDQVAKASVPKPTNRVSDWENTVGGVASQAVNTPILGSILNPALAVTSWLDDNIFEPIVEEVAALSPALISDVSKRNPNNSFFANWRLAREYANEVNIGQSWAEPLTKAFVEPFERLTGSPTFTSSLPYMDADFDLLDTEQREKYFKDDPVGIAISGGLSLGAMAVGSKGVGVGTRAARKAVFGSRVITDTEDLSRFNNRLNTAVTNIEQGKVGGPASDAMTKLLDDAVKATDVDQLLNNPLVAASNNPARSATILSRIDNPLDAADFLKAERGDKAALERLFKSQASAADAINNYGVKMTPLDDFAQVNALPDQLLANRLKNVLADIRKKDSELANALDNFAAEKASGVAISSYQPSRFAGIEKLNSTRARMKAMGQFGDLKLFGEAAEGSWKQTLYKSNAYDRGVRLITWAGTGRPQGWVNVSNPRRYESQYDILSELNRLSFLQGRRGADLKRRIIADYMEQTTDTGRAQALERAESLTLLEMAKYYGVGLIRGVDNDVASVERIMDWHKNIAPRKQSVRAFLDSNDMLPDADGNINVINLGIRANEPTMVPFMDLRALELEVIRQMGKMGDLKGPNPVSAGMMAKASVSRAAMGVGTFLDIANMVFSNLNLLRLAYIPKNSIIDPYFRASMDLETVFGMPEAIKGTRNFAQNSWTNLKAGGYRLGTAAERTKLRSELKKSTGILAENVTARRNASAQVARLEAERIKIADSAQSAADRLKSTKDAAKAARLEQRIAKYNARLADLDSQLTPLRKQVREIDDRLPSLEKGVGAIRNSLIDKETKLSTIRSKRKMIGQDTMRLVVDGEEYVIKGLADPSVKGARSYIAAVSAMDDFYNATRRSELSNKISAARNQFVTIDRSNWNAYKNALLHVANRQLRSELEEMGGMLLRGADVDEVMRWFKTPEGAEYLRRMLDRLPDKTNGGIRDWVQRTRDDIMRMYPDQRARNIILERDITDREIDAFFGGRTDMPERIKGPDIASGLAEQIRRESGSVVANPMSVAAASLGNISDLGWKFLSGFENRLVRNGLFMRYTKEAMEEQVRAARRAGLDITERTVHNGIRQQAYRAAAERIDQTLYSARRLTNAGYIMRYLLAFPAAFYNSQVIAMRLLFKNPANAMWYSNIIDSLDGFYPYKDEDGNVYKEYDDVPKGKSVSLEFPLYDVVGKTPFIGGALKDMYKGSMGLYTDPDGGGTKVNPKQMEFMLGDPSISWMGSILLSDAIKEGRIGPWQVYGEKIDKFLRDTFGDDVYESSILFQGRPIAGDNIIETTKNALIPTYMKSLDGAIGAFTRDSENGLFVDNATFARDLAANTKLAIREAVRNGTDYPSQIDVIKATGFMSFIKAVVQNASPIAVTFDPVTRAMTERYDEILAQNNGDQAAADDQYVREFGIEGLALLGSSTKNNSGLASTKRDLATYRKHSRLMYEMFDAAGRDPSVAGMLSYGYGDDSDEYDEITRAIFTSNAFPETTIPMSEKKQIEDYFNDPVRKMGWYEYNKLIAFRDSVMEQFGIESTQDSAYQDSGLKAYVEGEEQRLATKYRSWYVEKETSKSAFWARTFPALQKATDDQGWMNTAARMGTKWSEIADWTNATEKWYSAYEIIRTQPNADVVTLKDMRIAYSRWHFQYVNAASPEFQSFAARWLTVPELEDEKELVDNG